MELLAELLYPRSKTKPGNSNSKNLLEDSQKQADFLKKGRFFSIFTHYFCLNPALSHILFW